MADELKPDYTTMTVQELYDAVGDDAAKWAAAFCQHAKKIDSRAPDEGWMISWFANAIEHSTLVRNARAPTVPEGYALVPVVPNHALEDVFCEAWEDEKKSLIATEGSYTLAELFKAAWSAMLAAAPKVTSVPEGWRDISTAPTTGYFLAWSPDYPELVTCWKAELFHSARKPGTPRHLTANHWTHWRYIDTPARRRPEGARMNPKLVEVVRAVRMDVDTLPTSTYWRRLDEAIIRVCMARAAEMVGERGAAYAATTDEAFVCGQLVDAIKREGGLS